MLITLSDYHYQRSINISLPERKIANHNDNTSLNEMTVKDLTSAQQSEFIAQLMQQIAEMKRTQEPTNLAIIVNLPQSDNERPPFHFSSPDPSDQPDKCSSIA